MILLSSEAVRTPEIFLFFGGGESMCVTLSYPRGRKSLNRKILFLTGGLPNSFLRERWHLSREMSVRPTGIINPKSNVNPFFGLIISRIFLDCMPNVSMLTIICLKPAIFSLVSVGFSPPPISSLGKTASAEIKLWPHGFTAMGKRCESEKSADDDSAAAPRGPGKKILPSPWGHHKSKAASHMCPVLARRYPHTAHVQKKERKRKIETFIFTARGKPWEVKGKMWGLILFFLFLFSRKWIYGKGSESRRGHFCLNLPQFWRKWKR